MQIGVIADTPSKMHLEALEVLKGSDLIFHAGDVGRDEVLENRDRFKNRDRLILCTLVFCLGLSLSKMVFSNPLGLLFF